jgi:hypothetical protein
MRKLFFMLLLIPVLGMSQSKNVISSSKYFCKPEKIALFEKALAAHAQKYHTGDWKWRVWSIDSGPDAGGYMITEGPNNWSAIDGRGDISAEHQADWNNNVSPLTTERYVNDYLYFESELSTVNLTDYADKILVNHMISKPGRIGALRTLVSELKKMWTDGNESVAVYSNVGSGDPSIITVSRLRTGYKELDPGFRKPMSERFEAANGQGTFEKYLKNYEDNVERRWSELMIYMPKLSSK